MTGPVKPSAESDLSMKNLARIERIKKMEEHYEALREYMESGLWLEDFEADERGEVPPELKRGVLSEDGLYNLLYHADDLFGK